MVKQSRDVTCDDISNAHRARDLPLPYLEFRCESAAWLVHFMPRIWSLTHLQRNDTCDNLCLHCSLSQISSIAHWKMSAAHHNIISKFYDVAGGSLVIKGSGHVHRNLQRGLESD